MEANEFYYLLGPLILASLILVLRGLTKNPWIKKRLTVSLFLLFFTLILVILETVLPRFGKESSIPEQLDQLLIFLAIVVAGVVLIFNRFKGGAVSDKYPSIVQDAIIIAVFVLFAVVLAPEKLLTTSAVGALVVGLALQDTLGNLFSGLALQIEKPFFVGDWVKMAQLEGRVMEVTWRAAKIRTKAGEFCIIPNTYISKDTIINYTHPTPLLRIEKLIGFGYEAHPNKVKQVVMQTFSDISTILTDPRPDVLLEQYNDFSIDYRCRFWITDFADLERISDKFTTLLYYRLKRAGLRIPFPIRDVRIREERRAEPSAEELLERQLAYVDSVDLFGPLSEEEKRKIAERLETITFAADESIIKQGQSGDSMIFIDRGVVKVILEKNGTLSQLASLSEGQYFGEMALLTGEERTASVVAVTDVWAYILRKGPFKEVLLGDPTIAKRIAELMAKRKEDLDLKSSKMRPSVAEQARVQRSFMARIQRFFGI